MGEINDIQKLISALKKNLLLFGYPYEFDLFARA